MNALIESVFDVPWWLLGVVAAAAVAFLIWALPRGNRRLNQLATVVVVLVVLWALLAWLVVTPVEAARVRTLGLVRAYEAADWDRFDGLIDPETRFHTFFMGHNITRAAEISHEQFRPRSLRVLNIHSRRDDMGILVDVRILAEPDHAYGRPFTSAWRFDYRLRGGEWRLEHIEPRSTETTDVAAILRNIQVPPELQ